MLDLNNKKNNNILMEDNVYTKSTKYFGNVEVKFDNYPNVGNGHASILAVLRHQDIYVSNIFVSIFNYNSMGDKLALCWDIIDKYLEINTIAINAMVEKYSEKVKNILKNYFENNSVNNILIEKIFGVNDFEKINIKALVEKFKYPELHFYIIDSIWTFSVDYAFLETRFGDDIKICVTFNEELNVIGIEIEY